MIAKENFFLVGIKTPKRITLENHTSAFTMTTQLHTTFTILSIHSKEMLIMKGKEVRKKSQKTSGF